MCSMQFCSCEYFNLSLQISDLLSRKARISHLLTLQKTNFISPERCSRLFSQYWVKINLGMYLQLINFVLPLCGVTSLKRHALLSSSPSSTIRSFPLKNTACFCLFSLAPSPFLAMHTYLEFAAELAQVSLTALTLLVRMLFAQGMIGRIGTKSSHVSLRASSSDTLRLPNSMKRSKPKDGSRQNELTDLEEALQDGPFSQHQGTSFLTFLTVTAQTPWLSVLGQVQQML